MYFRRKYISQLKCTVELVGRVRRLQGSTGSFTEVTLVNRTGTQKKIRENNDRDTGDSAGSLRESDRGDVNTKHDAFTESCSHLREPLLDS